jgi:hypothetical protein
LALNLLVSPWFSIESGPIATNFSATDLPYGWTAVVAVVCALSIVIDLAIERLTSWKVPAIGGTQSINRLILAGVTAAFVLLKFLLHVDFRYFGWGFYLGVVLTIALVYFAVQARNAPAVTTAGPPAASAGPPAAGPPS